MGTINRQITLAARPVGCPKESDFKLVETPVPAPKPGQFVVRVIYLSVDPYMRGRLSSPCCRAAIERIADAVLREAVTRAEKGQIDADLGGEVIKLRIARPGEGKSKGYRTIVLFRRGARAFFVYGFPKSQRANIRDDEKDQFKEAAKHVLALSDKQLAELLKRGDFEEVKSE